jgi:protein ImuA
LAGAVAAPAAARPLDPELIHPELWRGHQLGRARHQVVPTGQPLLDHQLPGGGWPKQALTELLVRQPGVGEMRLLAPALATVARGQEGPARSLMLFGPPARPCAWGWQQLGLDPRSLIVIQPAAAGAGTAAPVADLLWALEQALRSGHAGAVLAWLPARLPPDTLRRLQLAAQAHDGPAFLFREPGARLKPSPAPLRLALQAAGPDALQVEVVKRRGPALAQPLRLPLPAPVALQRGWVPAAQAGVATRADALAAAGASAREGSSGPAG